MCWACEEEAMWRRYQLEVAGERGEIPPGFEPEDFAAAGLPGPAQRGPGTGPRPSLLSSGPIRGAGTPAEIAASAKARAVYLGEKFRLDEQVVN